MKAMACPRLVSDFCIPSLIWYQTDLTVVIRILLTDVPAYYLRVEIDHLLFSTIINSKKYYLVLHFFGPVIAEETVHKNVGREIKIYLTKALKWFRWLRLTFLKEKDPLITYDLDCIGETNQINFIAGEITKECKRQKKIKFIMPSTPYSEEEESEDDCFDLLQYA